MGMDVTMFAERKGPDGKWRRALPDDVCDVCGGAPMDSGWGPCWRCRSIGTVLREVRVARNYALFTILANVAGGDTSLPPIADARGVPSDADPQVAAQLNRSSFNRSWLSVAELTAYDWNARDKSGLTAKELAPQFCAEVLPALLALGPPDEVRVAFGFDV